MQYTSTQIAKASINTCFDRLQAVFGGCLTGYLDHDYFVFAGYELADALDCTASGNPALNRDK